jgi:hypothetical protein
MNETSATRRIAMNGKTNSEKVVCGAVVPARDQLHQIPGAVLANHVSKSLLFLGEVPTLVFLLDNLEGVHLAQPFVPNEKDPCGSAFSEQTQEFKIIDCDGVGVGGAEAGGSRLASSISPWRVRMLWIEHTVLL